MALRLSTRRDFGAGLVQPRTGAADGSSLLSTSLGLAWRLHRASALWWSAAIFLFGLGYGALAGEVDRYVADLSETIQDWLEGVGGETFLDSWLAVLALMVAVTVGLGVALYGLLPRATLLVWIVIACTGLIGMFADLFGLPGWTVDLSPFGHIPLLPAVGMRWTPVLVLTAIAAGLTAAELSGFRRRDLATTG